jgi:hypothetical protein
MDKNNTRNRYTFALGTAFIIQFITSLVSGGILFDPLVDKNDIVKTMLNISQNFTKAHFSLFLDIITVLVVIWLGVLLFYFLHKINNVWATVALVFYITEEILHIISKCFQFALIYLSSIYSTNANADLEIFGKILFEAKEFSGSISMIPFGIGAFMFYYLLYKSKALPTWVPIWGFLSVLLVLVVVPLIFYGIAIPFFVVFPYVPFELFIGIYILIKGLSKNNGVCPYVA